MAGGRTTMINDSSLEQAAIKHAAKTNMTTSEAFHIMAAGAIRAQSRGMNDFSDTIEALASYSLFLQDPQVLMLTEDARRVAWLSQAMTKSDVDPEHESK